MKNADPRRVKCRRDGRVWIPVVYVRRSPERGSDGKITSRDHLWIDCPTCCRGYKYEIEHDRWMSDRPLDILS